MSKTNKQNQLNIKQHKLVIVAQITHRKGGKK